MVVSRYSTFPDAEAMTIKVLKDAGICSGRVSSSRPATVILPLCIVQRLGGIPVDRTAIDSPRIQVDVWAANKSTARLQAEMARRAIHEAEVQFS